MNAATDTSERQAALDPSRSFIVQAPAGSGKTELLIQRYLRLLSVVKRPEQILAITFTRKSAGEMRARIFAALAAAAANGRPTEPHLQTGFELARHALRRDRELGWNLLLHAHRLRIQTIDALNAQLSAGVPFSAGFTAPHRISDAPEQLYRQAARQTITYALEPDSRGDAVQCLLNYFDNNVARLEQLLSAMLARRDLWLRHVVPAGTDTELINAGIDASLTALVERDLQRLRDLIPTDCDLILTELLCDAATRMVEDNRSPMFGAWQGVSDFPQPVAAELPRWQQLANLFLTKANNAPKWRRKLDARVGFPASRAGNAIERALALIQRFSQVDGLARAFANVRSLPDSSKDEERLAVAAALSVLPLAAANLKSVFRDRREKDFAEVAQEGVAALGRDDAPTDLGLQLDYRLQHILVDEFQDTSHAQYDLLRRLTAGWQAQSGESLFLVGDPMQSIYRFREAEVGLFLRARQYGIGDVNLDRLQLVANFRSDPAIVDWTNSVFSSVCRSAAGVRDDRVQFAPGVASHPSDPRAGVHWHTVRRDDADGEADLVLEIARDHLEHGDGTLGILVRSRSHARHLSSRLRSAGVRFGATDMERLVDHSVVQDLLALTRSLYHLGDRLAWLAVLRAPWCGLTLADLHALATRDLGAAIWTLINDDAAVANLSADGRVRIERLRKTMGSSLQRRGQLPVRDVVEAAWLDLGGPSSVTDAADCDWVDRFLDHLDTVEVSADIPDVTTITRQLDTVYLSSGDTACRVQVMTIHKAKGLEFDTVVLPGLARTPRSGDRPLLLTYDAVDLPTADTPLFAVRNSATGDDDSLYEYLWRLERSKTAMELDRLLYVATTRAKKRLHMLAGLDRHIETGDLKPPPVGSLLNRIWSEVADELGSLDSRERQVTVPGTDIAAASAAGAPDWQEVLIKRLPASWSPADAVLLADDNADEISDTFAQALEYEWASGAAIFVGKIVHRWLQEFAVRGLDQVTDATIESLRPVFCRQLLRFGIAADEADAETQRVVDALTRTLNDERGRWILSAEHAEAENELPLTHDAANGIRQLVIDRTFVADDGERWLIDYKTGGHEGGSVDAFVDSEAERYRDQLRRYRDSLRELDSRQIRAALYFPMLGVLRVVELDEQQRQKS